MEVLPGLVIHGEARPFAEGEEQAFGNLDLGEHLDGAVADQILLEPEYQVTDTFVAAHGLEDLRDGTFFGNGASLSFANVRPDIIHVVPPDATMRRSILPDGRLEDVEDRRSGLEIVDIKISGEASPAHFAELAYYGMTLSAWLIEHGYDDGFYVIADAAVWPGRHDASSIERQLRADVRDHVVERRRAIYLAAFAQDLERMPPEVVLGRVSRFLRHDLRTVLAPADWRELPWHVDRRCLGCDYLGYRWSTAEDAEAGIATPAERGRLQESQYCWTMAREIGHPSRIAGLTEGATGKLYERGIVDVATIAAIQPGNPVFELHQTLRSKRTIFVARGVSLNAQQPADIPDRAGTSAVLPSFADIRVYVSADFDVASGLTFAFGSYISYGVPNADRDAAAGRRGYGRAYNEIRRPMLVLERSPDAEGRMLRQWLTFLVQDIMRARDDILAGYRRFNPDKEDISIQFYMWDNLIFDHLCRVMGRHLELVLQPIEAGGVDVSPVSWLFPAETVLEDARFVDVSSPITIVSQIVNSLMAAPVPHHYGLVELANAIDADRRVRDGRSWGFRVNKFYLDPLSDQIPSERGTEIWEQRSPFRTQDFQWHQEQTRRVVIDKLRAVSWVVDGLQRRLQDTLSAEAPNVGEVFAQVRPLTGVGFDGQMVYQHARLMHAARKLENDLLMAMPPHEREARFMSARVERTLLEAERAACLRDYDMGASVDNPRIFVFQLRAASREVRLKDGDFLFSFLPEDVLSESLHDTVAGLKRRYPALARRRPIDGYDYHNPARAELRVSVRKIDRARQRLVLEVPDLLFDLIQLGIADLNFDPARSRFGILDEVVIDYFTRRLKVAFSGRQGSPGIRNPPLAVARPLFTDRIANVARLRAARTASVPAETFIWNADVASQSVTGMDAVPVVDIARQLNPGLTGRQTAAIENSVERRLALWWGPPGTGKSATAQALLAGSLADAAGRGAGLRIAITAVTWVAIDHVARRLPDLLQRLGIADGVVIARLVSGAGSGGQIAPELEPYVLPMDSESRDLPGRIDLENALADRNSLVVVASTVDQLAKLGRDVVAPLFDFMLIDEASQVDVAHAIVAFTKLAPNARLTVVGDDLQMAPIHPIEAPEGAEHLVGSIFDFYRNYRGAGINRTMLDRSFRSNREIIDFVKLAGYPDLHASPQTANRRYDTSAPFADARPAAWQEDLPWSPAFATILDPNEPLSAVIHTDRFSSQRNQEEADLVAGLVVSLFEAGLMDIDDGNRVLLSAADFFRKGIGIVTPHRAQQAAVFERLATALAGRVDENEIFAAVDTVERFQGQEKTVMIASFGLGDKDQIAAEEVFLFNLNRFNVTASRAKAKFIGIMSRRLVDHLPSDKDALIESRLLKHFVDGVLRRTDRISVQGFEECWLHRA